MRFGQWKTNSILREKIDRNAKYIWFHASSLGEFEQGRPMIEKIKAEHPEYKVLLTFFSPSPKHQPNKKKNMYTNKNHKL